VRPDVFQAEISVVDASCVVELSGELDLATVAEAEIALQVARALAGDVTLDLRRLEFIDVPGVHLIMRQAVAARRDGVQLCVVARAGSVRRLLALTGIDGYINLVDTFALSQFDTRAESAVIAADLGGIVIIWNTAAARLYGWSALEVLGRSIMEVTVGPDDRRVAEQIMREVERAGYWEGEFEVSSKSGRRFPARVRDVLITDEHGNIVGVVGVSVESSKAYSH
jgi:anti-anti-sigma factor